MVLQYRLLQHVPIVRSTDKIFRGIKLVLGPQSMASHSVDMVAERALGTSQTEHD